MADSFAALAYGVCARSCDVVVAGRAFPTLAAPLRALDLIRLRRLKDKLHASIGTSS